MKIFVGAAAFALSFGIFIAPAHARPPTVRNSPGYDARLVESRKALEAAQPVQQNLTTPAPQATPTGKSRRKRTHTN